MKKIDLKNLDELSREIRMQNERKGFITNWECLPAKLMLIVTEVAEAMEAYRDQDRAEVIHELCDVLVRTFDLLGALDCSVSKELGKVLENNEKRPYRHGRKIGL